MAQPRDKTDIYYFDQLCPVGPAVMGGICLCLYTWQRPMLALMVPTEFQFLVLLCGILLVAVTMIRFAGIIIASKKRLGDCENHVEHSDARRTCAPWRYVVVLVPIVFFILGLPAKSRDTIPSGESARVVSFALLEEIAVSAENRKNWQGQIICVEGRYSKSTSNEKRQNEFTMFRLRRDPDRYSIIGHYTLSLTCDEPMADIMFREWIRVIGTLDFRDEAGKFRPVLRVSSGKSIVPTREPAFPLELEY